MSELALIIIIKWDAVEGGGSGRARDSSAHVAMSESIDLSGPLTSEELKAFTSDCATLGKVTTFRSVSHSSFAHSCFLGISSMRMVTSSMNQSYLG